VDASPGRYLLNTSPHNQQMVLEKWKHSNLKEQIHRLIEWGKAGLENLLVSTYITRRIRRRAIRNYQIGECQNSPYPFNIAPTTLQ
jgi:heme A synthase